MKRIDTVRLQPSESNPNKLEYAGQRTVKEIFKELEYRLKITGYLPDEYFKLNDEFENGREFPQDADIICNANWGANAGVYLDISMRYADEKGNAQTVNLATGKSLGDNESDLDRMFLTASACTKAFYCRGEYAKNLEVPKEVEKPMTESKPIDTEKSRESEKVTLDNTAKPLEPSQADSDTRNDESITDKPKEPEKTTVIHLNDRERQLIADSLLETRFRLQKEKKPLFEVENLLRRIIGNISDYIKTIGQKAPDYADMASISIADGNVYNFRHAIEQIPHMHGNLLNDTVLRPDKIGRQMTE